MSSRRDTGGGRRPWKRYSASQASSGSASTSTPAAAPATAAGAAVMTVARAGAHRPAELVAEEPVDGAAARLAQRVGDGHHRGQAAGPVPAGDLRDRRGQGQAGIADRERAVRAAGEAAGRAQQPVAARGFLRCPPPLGRRPLEVADRDRHGRRARTGGWFRVGPWSRRRTGATPPRDRRRAQQEVSTGSPSGSSRSRSGLSSSGLHCAGVTRPGSTSVNPSKNRAMSARSRETSGVFQCRSWEMRKSPSAASGWASPVMWLKAR